MFIKKLIFISLILFLTPIFLRAQDTFDLKISVTNIDKLEGVLRVCLGNKKEDFLKNCFQSQEVEVTQKEMIVVFKNVPKGNYVVNIYHDEDNNGKLNRNGIFRSPSEDYGFSNNPRSFFGPPKFNKCLFEINSHLEMSIAF